MGRTRNLSNLVSDDMLSIDTSGNIGFGTETPSKSLDVVGILSTTTFSGGHYSGTVETTNAFTKNLNTTGIVTTTGMFSGDGSNLVGVAFTCAAIISDVKSSGSHGGNPFPGSNWKYRDLQTILSDPHNIIVSINGSNGFTLGPGVYQFRYIVPTLRTNSTTARIYNITDSWTVTGSYAGNEWSQQSGWYAGTVFTGVSGFYRWTSGNKEFALYYINQYHGLTQQMGFDTHFENEYFTQVYILKGNV